MKNATSYIKPLAALLRKLKQRYKAADPTPHQNPVTELVLSFLQWNATRKTAEAAFDRLMEGVVDTNDLRVSDPDEITELLGQDYPRLQERTARLQDALQEIYIREHAVTLDPLATMPKKDARAYLASLPGMPVYVTARVMLLGLDAHAVPVDDHLADLLKQDGIVDPDATVEQIEAFLERHVKASDAPHVQRALQAWADSRQKRSPPAGGSRSDTRKKAPGRTRSLKKRVKKK